MLVNEHLTRQSGLIPFRTLEVPVTIIGAGATGSNTAIGLARMGIKNIEVWDFDTVDIVNMNNQGYRFKDIGSNKVDALADIIMDNSNIQIKAMNRMYTGEQRFSGIVICALDSMEGRKMMWDWHRNHPWCKAFIDPRMGAEEALLYVMNPNSERDIETYEKTLYSDSEAERPPCTEAATIYCSTMLSGLVVKAVKDIITDNPYPRITLWSIRSHDFNCSVEQAFNQ